MERYKKYDFDKVYKSARFHWKWGKTYSEEIPTDIIDWYANEIAKPSIQFIRGGNGTYFNINFCPMCGRDLRKEDKE